MGAVGGGPGPPATGGCRTRAHGLYLAGTTMMSQNFSQDDLGHKNGYPIFELKQGGLICRCKTLPPLQHDVQIGTPCSITDPHQK